MTKIEKNYIIRLIILLILFLIAIIWKPFLIFIIPGILILFISCFKKIDLISLLAYIFGLSMSFWIVSFWFLKYIPLKLTTLFLLITLITLIISLYFSFKPTKTYKISLNYYNFILIALFLLVLALRFIPMALVIAPAGADMSMHTYITNLIINANTIPESYYPVLGIDKFNTYPAGFHTLSALISLTGNIHAFRSTFIMTCLTYFFITLFLYVFLRKFVSGPSAFISTIFFNFLTINPQGFAGWGGNPTIFALALFILFISFLDRINESKYIIFFSAITLASVLLSHSIIFIQSFYIFGISFLIYILLKKEYKKYKWIKYLLIIILFFLLTTPYLINFDYKLVSPETKEWIKHWVRETGDAWHDTIYNFIWTIPFYIKGYIFNRFIEYSLIICVIGLIFLIIKNPKRAIQYISFLILGILLILNTKYWILPFSYAIYPERVATMTIIPLSLFFAYAFETFFKYIIKRKMLSKKILSILIIILLILIMILALLFNHINHVNIIHRQSTVTKADINAFNWLKKNTDKTEVIQNNYGDGGLWIPSILFRPTTTIHVPIPAIKTKPLGKPKYIYIGKKCVYNCKLKNSEFTKNDKYKLIYSQNDVYIYEILK